MIAKIERYQSDLSWIKARGEYTADESLTREILGLDDEGVVELLALAGRLTDLGYPGFLKDGHGEWILSDGDLFLSAFVFGEVRLGAWGEVKGYPTRVKLSRTEGEEKVVLRLSLKLDEARALWQEWGEAVVRDKICP